ncbi:MAG: hypothetical protein M1824_005472 [Vezdaea acicularis]|nr:MAG: hypothetical protein M1824_005472 [Vezdaea acicularis]
MDDFMAPLDPQPALDAGAGSGSPTNQDPPNFVFASGCRVVDDSRTQKTSDGSSSLSGESSKANPQENFALKEGDRYVCLWPNCNSNFSRVYELKRHLKNHFPSELIPCPAVNCKYRGKRAFKRLDLFFEHARRVHDDDTLWMCPKAQSCGLEDSLKKIDFVEHLRNAHHVIDRYHMKTILRYFDIFYKRGTSRCFISTCGKDCNDLEELQKHVAGCHSQAALWMYFIIKWYGRSHVYGFCLICSTDILSWDGLSLAEHLEKHDRSTLLEFKDQILSDSSGLWAPAIRGLREVFERLE